jgi:hypothetical protein
MYTKKRQGPLTASICSWKPLWFAFGAHINQTYCIHNTCNNVHCMRFTVHPRIVSAFPTIPLFAGDRVRVHIGGSSVYDSRPAARTANTREIRCCSLKLLPLHVGADHVQTSLLHVPLVDIEFLQTVWRCLQLYSMMVEASPPTTNASRVRARIRLHGCRICAGRD